MGGRPGRREGVVRATDERGGRSVWGRAGNSLCDLCGQNEYIDGWVGHNSSGVGGGVMGVVGGIWDILNNLQK